MKALQIGVDDMAKNRTQNRLKTIVAVAIVSVASPSFGECQSVQGIWQGACEDQEPISLALNIKDCLFLYVNGERFLLNGSDTTHQSLDGGAWTITRSSSVDSKYSTFEIDRTETSISFGKRKSRIESRSSLKKIILSGDKLHLTQKLYTRDSVGSHEKQLKCELNKS